MKIKVLRTALFIFLGLISAHIAPLSIASAKTPPKILQADAGVSNNKGAVNCPKVEMFVTSWCGYCKMLEDILDKNGIPYTIYDVEKDESAAQVYRELKGRGVPLVRVGSKVVYGYNPDMVLSYVKGK